MNRAATIATTALIASTVTLGAVLSSGSVSPVPDDNHSAFTQTPTTSSLEISRFDAQDPMWAVALSTPCNEEDSVNCYWLASTMGNGRGESFVSIRDTTFYLK